MRRMSLGDRAEGVARLRCAVAAIEGRREAAPARAAARLPLTRALDRALGGGLAADGLHEIAPASALDGAAAMGFALALAARFIAVRRGAAIVMAEDFALAELGALYGPGLAAFGLDLSPARLRPRARRAGSVPGDGGRAEERRAGGGDRRSLAAQDLRPRRRRAACCSPRGPAARRRC